MLEYCGVFQHHFLVKIVFAIVFRCIPRFASHETKIGQCAVKDDFPIAGYFAVVFVLGLAPSLFEALHELINIISEREGLLFQPKPFFYRTGDQGSAFFMFL